MAILGDLLRIGGTVVGALTGNPLLAYLGSQVGNAVANLIEGPLEGPRLEDTRVRASTYGIPIPLIYGDENRSGGNMIWAPDLIVRSKKSGNFITGETKSFLYYADLAISLGQGPMTNLEALYANGQLIWSKEENLRILADIKERRDNPSTSFADSFFFGLNPELTEYIDNYDPDLAFPDNTPWIIGTEVTANPDGTGEFVNGVSGAYVQGGPFRRLEWYPGTTDQPPSYTILQNKADTSAYRGTAYFVLHYLELSTLGLNQIPTIEVVVKGLGKRTVAGVVEDICTRAGMDLTEAVPRGILTKFPVRGYTVATANTAMAAIVPLANAYPFDACEHGGVVRFTPRQVGPMATITIPEMGSRVSGADYEVPREIERMPDFEMANTANVTYTDPENDYQANTQSAQRAGGTARTINNQQLALTLGADAARNIAERYLWEGWLSRENYRIKLDRRYDFLQPGNTIAVPTPGGNTLLRILNIDRGDNTVIEMRASKEERLAYEGTTAGGRPFVFQQTPVNRGETAQYSYNAHAIFPGEETSTGFHVALSGQTNFWPGGSVFRSVDGGTSYTDVLNTNDDAPIGGVNDATPDGPTAIWDRINTIEVQMVNPNAAGLQSLPEAELLANPRANLLWVGLQDGSDGELMQYANITEITDGTLRVDTLLRGRRGTEYYTSQHVAEEIAVFIPATGTPSLNFGQSDWNQLRRHKGVTDGAEESLVVSFQGFTATGERLRPWAVVDGAGVRDVSDNLTISWVRRSRSFPPTLGSGSVPLDEATELYDVEILDGATVVRTEQVTDPEYAYSAANQTSDGLTPGDPVTARIYQISAVRGRGISATFTV